MVPPMGSGTDAARQVAAEQVLPGGLVLRPCRPADLAQVGDLLAARGDPTDAEDHRLVVEDPDTGWDSWRGKNRSC